MFLIGNISCKQIDIFYISLKYLLEKNRLGLVGGVDYDSSQVMCAQAGVEIIREGKQFKCSRLVCETPTPQSEKQCEKNFSKPFKKLNIFFSKMIDVLCCQDSRKIIYFVNFL